MTPSADTPVGVLGVGYVVRCGSRTLSRLPALGEEAVLHIDSQTREDGTRLYGFLTREERAVFAALQSVQGRTADESLGRMETQVDERLARADAMAQLAGDDLDSRFSDLETEQQVESDLADLKSKMGKS